MSRWHFAARWLPLALLLGIIPSTRADDPKGVRTLEGHTGSVMAVAFSLDGKTLVTSSRDKTIRFWNVGTGKLERTLTEHTGAVYSVVVSPKGDLLASGSADKTVKLWEVPSAKR